MPVNLNSEPKGSLSNEVSGTDRGRRGNIPAPTPAAIERDYDYSSDCGSHLIHLSFFTMKTIFIGSAKQSECVADTLSSCCSEKSHDGDVPVSYGMAHNQPLTGSDKCESPDKSRP